MKRFHIYVLYILTVVNIFGNQLNAQSFEFAQDFEFLIDHIMMNDSNQTVTIGTFNGTKDFDPSDSLFMLSASSSAGFIAKYDSVGNLVQALKFGDYTSSYPTSENFFLTRIVEGVYGNYYIIGNFEGVIDFAPGPKNSTFTSINDFNVIVLKFDSLLNHVWSKQLVGGNSTGISLAVDDRENIFLTGKFEDSVDFDPDTSSYYLDAGSQGNSDIFLCKLDSAGDLQFVHSFGQSKYNDLGYDIDTDVNGNVYLGSKFVGTVDFDPSASVNNLSSGSSSGYRNADMAIVKFDNSGNFKWGKNNDGVFNGYGKNLLINENRLYAVGSYAGTKDFDPGPSIFNLTPVAYDDVFLWELDTSGNFVSATSFGGSSSESARNVGVDSNGNLYISGIFRVNIDLDPGSANYNLNASSGWDQFFCKLDSNKNFVWGTQLGGSHTMIDGAMYINRKGDLFSTGEFKDSVDFNPGPFSSILSSNSYRSFLYKLGECEPVFDSVAVQSCDMYISPSNKYPWFSSGIYTDTIISYSGCDSVVTIDLDIINLDTTVTQNGVSLISNSTNASYQWLDCNNGYFILQSDTNQTFVASSNGSYAVEIRKNNCVDTSQCAVVLNVGLENFQNTNWFKVYPNPTAQNVIIETEQAAIDYTLMDMMGKVIKSGKLFGNKTVLQLNVADGIYYLRIRKKQNSQVIKLIKN